MMKFLLTIILTLLFSNQFVQAQTHTISGVLEDENGEPIPGVTIQVKGTNIGTATDVNGSYSIEAKPGDVLVFSGIGFNSREVTVGESLVKSNQGMDNTNGRKDSVKFDFERFLLLGDSAKSEKDHITEFNDDSPDFKFEGQYQDRYIDDIFRLKKNIFKGRNLYTIKDKPYDGDRYSNAFHVSFQSAFSIQNINRLPSLQSSFAQGRPFNGVNTWRGPETGEIFSWGPALSSLEFTGTTYPFDPNGSLTNKGSGNGNTAKTYNPLQFFQQGQNWSNAIQISKGNSDYDFYAGIQYEKGRGILPGNTSESFNLNIKYYYDGYGFTLKSYAIFQTNHTKLPQIGSNWQNLIGSVYSTPPSFDNTNGLNPKDASKNTDSYSQANGQKRSYSPLLTDNPYGLSSTIPDQKKNQQWALGFEINFKNLRKYNPELKLGFESIQENQVFGMLADYSGNINRGRYTERNKTTRDFYFRSGNTLRIFNYNNDDFKLDVNIDYQLSLEYNELKRQDALGIPSGSGFDLSKAGSLNETNFEKNRIKQEFFVGIKSGFFDGFLELDIQNTFYFSNTLPNQDNNLFLPSILARFDFDKVFNRKVGNFILNFSYSRSLKEVPLVYNQWDYNSINLSSSNYNQYYPSNELLFNNSTVPELYEKMDIGIYYTPLYRLSLSINYFQNTTFQLISPVWQNNEFSLQNTGNLQSKGIEATISYGTQSNYYYYRKNIAWETQLSYSVYRPYVSLLYNQNPIPLAGYSNISTNMAEGQPFGVIMGSAYQRNSEGQILIDAQGYPIVDNVSRYIGNPVPDFILKWTNSLKLYNFYLSIDLEFRKGGQIWNGTKNTLDYLGVSQLSADQRNITGFIFSGINPAGLPNQTPVDFANPANGLGGNRWVRYGFAGVGEDAIEDATSFRINEIKLSYNFSRLWRKLTDIRSSTLKLSIYSRNILLMAPYSGIDPASSFLMNYRQGSGLDLFNQPGTITYGLQLNMSF